MLRAVVRGLQAVERITPRLAVWRGLAAAKLKTKIAALTMVLLRAHRWCDDGAAACAALVPR